MNTENLIPVNVLCTHYRVEMSFFSNLDEIGLLELQSIEESQYVPSEKIGDVEKILRMQHELNLNLEAIDVVFHLLDKVSGLQKELHSARSRLLLYEA